MHPRIVFSVLSLFALELVQFHAIDAAETQVDYQRVVRPILAMKCFKCHGPDEATREADLRLDTFAGATLQRESSPAIVPGDVAQSLLIQRITHASPDELMPPPDSGLSLNETEKAVLKKWIEQGGTYAQHWAFVKPTPPPLPTVMNSAWPRNSIDHFILSRLEQVGLTPSPEADRYTLVRRLYLDLTGLPPTLDQADAFVHNPDPVAYEQLVDELLASPQYGERWARHWLDLARYADTNGYEKDRPRSIWPYRDWVIQALNQDQPFDQFTIEQLAGDMLANPSTSQLIATGFHRNTMLNEEGGIDPLEYRFYSMVDRVATTGTVWLGMTIGCAQCHTHKYDPITHTDYYALLALLNNADEPDLILHDAHIERQRENTMDKIAEMDRQLSSAFPPDSGEGDEETRRQRNLEIMFANWLNLQRQQVRHWNVITPQKMSTNLPRLEVLEDGSILSTGDITKRDVFQFQFDLAYLKEPVTAIRLEALPDERLPARGPGRAFYEGRKGDFFLSEFSASTNGTLLPLHGASHSFGKISIGSGSANAANVLDGDGSTGWSTATREGEPHELVLNFTEPFTITQPLEVELLFERHFAASLGRFRFSVTTAPGLSQAMTLPVEFQEQLIGTVENSAGTNDTQVGKQLTEQGRNQLLQLFLYETPELTEARKPIEELRKKLVDFPTTMILQERPLENPRQTYRQHRGEYLQVREEVVPGLPALFQESATSHPVNRLEFAHWLVSPENPLVGRVTVNRNWQEFFGRGLVKTSEDFGTQSSFPSHPELLDWLACALSSKQATDPNALHWSIKRLHRLIVTSATYRQQSLITSTMLEQDPENILLARGPRFRIPAEMIRDLALTGSGLLSFKVGGPSVYPPQPQSVYSGAYGSPQWPVSQGEDRYRRSLYTFVKRTAPFAAYTTFDAPTGESCIVRRDRSNTPLQALTLLNDELFLEAATAAAATCYSTDRSKADIATSLFRRFQTRHPDSEELSAILEFYENQLKRIAAGELDTKSLIGDQIKEPVPEIAAWMLVARVILNLDETVIKP